MVRGKRASLPSSQVCTPGSAGRQALRGSQVPLEVRERTIRTQHNATLHWTIATMTPRKQTQVDATHTVNNSQHSSRDTSRQRKTTPPQRPKHAHADQRKPSSSPQGGFSSYLVVLDVHGVVRLLVAAAVCLGFAHHDVDEGVLDECAEHEDHAHGHPNVNRLRVRDLQGNGHRGAGLPLQGNRFLPHSLCTDQGPAQLGFITCVGSLKKHSG